jgi:transcriptional regulator with XRE-family HTH domain
MRNDMEHIGMRIRALREQSGASHDDLADALNVSSDEIRQIETGVRGLASEELAMLSQRLGVTTDEILFPARDGAAAGTLLRGEAGPDAERVQRDVERAFANLRYVRSLVES